MPSREPHTHGKTFSSFLLPFRFHTVPENPGGLAPGSNDFSDWCLQTVSLSHLSLAAALPACLPLSLHVTPLLCSLSPVRLSPGAGGLGVHLRSRPALSVLHALPVGPDFLPAPGSGSAALPWVACPSVGLVLSRAPLSHRRDPSRAQRCLRYGVNPSLFFSPLSTEKKKKNYSFSESPD